MNEHTMYQVYASASASSLEQLVRMHLAAWCEGARASSLPCRVRIHPQLSGTDPQLLSALHRLFR